MPCWQTSSWLIELNRFTGCCVCTALPPWHDKWALSCSSFLLFLPSFPKSCGSSVSSLKDPVIYTWHNPYTFLLNVLCRWMPTDLAASWTTAATTATELIWKRWLERVIIRQLLESNSASSLDRISRDPLPVSHLIGRQDHHHHSSKLGRDPWMTSSRSCLQRCTSVTRPSMTLLSITKNRGKLLLLNWHYNI